MKTIREKTKKGTKGCKLIKNGAKKDNKMHKIINKLSKRQDIKK